MSYITAAILKSHIDAEWLTGDPAPEGFSEAAQQVDDLIYQKTGIVAPDDSATARPVLRSVACKIFIWLMSGHQSNLEEQELKRRRQQYEDAMALLDAIASGEVNLLNADGTKVKATKAQFFTNQRITGAL